MPDEPSAADATGRHAFPGEELAPDGIYSVHKAPAPQGRVNLTTCWDLPMLRYAMLQGEFVFEFAFALLAAVRVFFRGRDR